MHLPAGTRGSRVGACMAVAQVAHVGLLAFAQPMPGVGCTRLPPRRRLLCCAICARRVVEGGSGGGKRAPLAPRAVVCIDSATGRRFKALPIEGVVEAIHSTGKGERGDGSGGGGPLGRAFQFRQTHTLGGAIRSYGLLVVWVRGILPPGRCFARCLPPVLQHCLQVLPHCREAPAHCLRSAEAPARTAFGLGQPSKYAVILLRLCSWARRAIPGGGCCWVGLLPGGAPGLPRCGGLHLAAGRLRRPAGAAGRAAGAAAAGAARAAEGQPERSGGGRRGGWRSCRAGRHRRGGGRGRGGARAQQGCPWQALGQQEELRAGRRRQRQGEQAAGQAWQRRGRRREQQRGRWQEEIQTQVMMVAEAGQLACTFEG